MNTLSILPVSRTSRLSERSSIATPRDSKTTPPSPTATASQRDSAMNRFLTTLLHSLSTWAA